MTVRESLFGQDRAEIRLPVFCTEANHRELLTSKTGVSPSPPVGALWVSYDVDSYFDQSLKDGFALLLDLKLMPVVRDPRSPGIITRV